MIEAASQTPQSHEEEPPGRPIRVAHVGELADVSASGVDRTIAGLVTHLPSYGVEPEVWHMSSRRRSVSERRVGSVSVFEIPTYSSIRSALLGLPAETRDFIRQRRTGVHLLHLHSVFIPENVRVARLAGLPYVLTPHGGYSPEVLRGRNRLAKTLWMRMRERNYVGGASLIQAVGPHELDQLRATFDTDALVHVPNGIDAPEAPAVPRDRLRTPSKLVVFLGRLAVDHKGLDILLEGYARYVANGHGKDTELTLAGPDFRSGQARLEALASRLLPDGGVRFVGPLFGEEKDSLLRTARVFVHTSRWEGMPYAILEALVAGCPILLTRATNLGELVEEYGAGVVVEGTPEGVRDGLRSILETSPERYEAMCREARRLGSERFTWASVAEQLSTAYRRIIG